MVTVALGDVAASRKFSAFSPPPPLDLKVIYIYIIVTNSKRYSRILVVFRELLYIKYRPFGESCQNSFM